MINTIKPTATLITTATTVKASRNAERKRCRHAKKRATAAFWSEFNSNGKYEQQQLFHKIDTRHHKHQQQQDFKICRHLSRDMFRAGHADEYRFDSQQTTGEQRVKYFRATARVKNKFRYQQPASDERADEEN